MRVLRPIQTLSPVLSHALTRRPQCSISQQHSSRLHVRCTSRTFTLPQPACSSRRPMRALCTASAAYDEAGATSTASPAAAELSRQVAQEKPLSVIEGRERLRAAMPAEALRVAGVTFEGRQELVAALQPDQALMLEKEPENEYDPNAIRIQTLSGAVLGYVPRDLTARFPYPVTFGHVCHLGQVPDSGLWGALVAVRPTLPPLTVDAFPDAALPHMNLASALSKQDWERLCRSACRRASYRCEISGGVSGEEGQAPVECAEVWEFDDQEGVLRLAGLQALAAEVQLAKRVLRHKGAERQRQAAMWTLQAMNEWSIMEAEAYLRHVEGVTRQRSQRSWRFDWSWLEANGVRVPEQLPMQA